MMTTAQRQQRIDTLMVKYPSINRKKHFEGLHICQNYIFGNGDSFDKMFEAAYKRVSSSIRRTANRLINEQGKEDLIAETMSTTVVKVHIFHGWSRYSTWMKGIARHEILTFIKKKESEPEICEYDDGAHGHKVSYMSIAHWEDDQITRDMMKSLSEIERLVVISKAINNRSFAKIASELHVSAVAVRSCYLRALKKIKNEYLQRT